MKKLILLLTLAQCAIAQPYDFTKGIDLTGQTSITASKLNQLVDNATPNSDRGLLIITNGIPDAVNITKFRRYMWLNTAFNPPTPMLWHTPNAYWTNITAIANIADGSVTALKLAANAVTAPSIANNAVTDVAIISGAITSSKYFAGSISNLAIAGYTINSTNIANNQITSTNLATASVTGDKIAINSIGMFQLTNGFALAGTNIANGAITAVNIATNAVALTNIIIGAATTGDSIRYNGAAFEFGKAVRVFTSTNATIPAADGVLFGIGGIAHGLDGVPSIITVSLVCFNTTVTHTYAVGDVIPITSIGASSNPAYRVPATAYANVTSFNVAWHEAADWILQNKATGANYAINTANLALNFRVQVTLVRFPY